MDSKHPDREKQVGVLFRDWLTEEEYLLAKQRQELGHQISLRQITATDVSVNVCIVSYIDLSILMRSCLGDTREGQGLAL